MPTSATAWGHEDRHRPEATEQIVGNAEAMKLFKREYRAPYVIPEQIR